jgi:class 3 adenylate cyclase
MDDVRAVMDAVGSQHATLFGISEGGAMCMLFSATYPERVDSMILAGATARYAWAPDNSWGVTEEGLRAYLAASGEDRLAYIAKSKANDPGYAQWYARWQRMCASPGAAAMIMRIALDMDARHVLSSISAPTLILHSGNDGTVPVQHGRYLAKHIAGAKYVELTGPDHLPWLADSETVLGEVTEFLTGTRPAVEPDRVLATVLFTDIVGATEKAASIGDRAWRGLLGNHHAAVRRNLVRFRGREIDTAGDGFLAAFDGPARAVRCAQAISDDVRSLGIEVRAGLHTGECELMGEKLGGIAVHIGARVAALASAGEVLVSSTVKDLVAGSGLSFADRGIQALKGVPGEWHLYAAQG